MRDRLRSILKRTTRTSERLLRATFGDPPRSDRGVELDPRIHGLLSLMRLAGLGKLHHLSVEQARRSYERDGGFLDLPRARLAQTRELEVPGATGPLRARLYRPHEHGGGPLLVWFHGGGYVIGNLDTHAGVCSRLAARSGCAVVAVDYRKSPEHRFPAASDDALASFRWIREHARELGSVAERVAVGGDSAGANLSAGLCHRLRELGEAQPRLQVLIYPSTQHGAPMPSRTHFDEGMMLTGELIAWFRDHYLPGPEYGDDPLVSPLLAASFEGLAPALIRTAGFDPLRDEGLAYAEALRGAGVEVDYRCHEQLIHGYMTIGRVSPAIREANDALADELAAALGSA